jgi:hypothetical protein
MPHILCIPQGDYYVYNSPPLALILNTLYIPHPIFYHFMQYYPSSMTRYSKLALSFEETEGKMQVYQNDI